MLLQMIILYHEIREGKKRLPRTLIMGGKAAAGYLPKAGPIKIGNQTIWGIRVDWQGEPGIFD